jgi:hypothetical protein
VTVAVHTVGGVGSKLDQPWHELGLRVEILAQLPDNLYRADPHDVELEQARLVPTESSAYLVYENAGSPAN